MNTLDPNLHELQKWMRWAITDPRGVDPALADPAPKSGDALKYPGRYNEPTRRLLGFVSGHPPLPASERLSIYAEGYFARLLESLSSDFEATRAVLGEESFFKLVADYLKAYPSACANIGEVGEKLTSFLSEHELGIENPELVELAGLEWAVIESFYADEHASAARLNPSALQSIAAEAWPGASFELDASVRLMPLRFEVEKIWYERHDEPALTAAMGELTPSAACSGLLLFKDGDGHVEVERLENLRYRILRRMSEGATLGEICEGLEPGADGEFPPLMQWFSDWVARGVIASVKHAGDVC